MKGFRVCGVGVVHIVDAVLMPDSLEGGDDEDVDGNDDKDPNEKIPVCSFRRHSSFTAWYL